jgi:ribosomal protein S18 acetylase RimI-like enzyme
VDDSWTISPARTDERDAALRVVFAHLPDDARPGRIAQIHDLIAVGEIDPQGLFIARQGGQIRGVFVCIPMPGKSALVWAPRGPLFDPLPTHRSVPLPSPPVLRGRGAGGEGAEPPATASPTSTPPPGATNPLTPALSPGVPGEREALVVAGLDWLRQRGGKIAQVIVPTEESQTLLPLACHGFVPAGPMLFLQHDLAALPDESPLAGLRLVPLPNADSDLFARTLNRTYEGTLDFPELSNVRTIDEILASYRASPVFRPEHWLLAFLDDEPAGVLMLSELDPLEGWDLTYLGVVPEQRKKGVGQSLVASALRLVADAAGARLDVAVDARNRPALQLYGRLGFQLMGERLVSLVFLTPTP